jgi:hypothetical protein
MNMNGLYFAKSANTLYPEQISIVQYVYGIINSKIEFVELNTRKILDKLRDKNVKGSHLTDESTLLPSMPNIEVNTVENEQLFEHFEVFSRSICVLEQMKFSLREENAMSVMQLLDDDNYLKVNDLQIKELLNAKPES